MIKLSKIKNGRILKAATVKKKTPLLYTGNHLKLFRFLRRNLEG